MAGHGWVRVYQAVRRGRAFVGIVALLGISVMPLLSPSVVRAQSTIVHSGDVQGLKDAINTLNMVSGTNVIGALPPLFTAGVPFAITVQVVSEFGGLLTKYAGTLHTFNSDPLGSAPADYTFTRSDGGTHDFTITFGNAGGWDVIISERERSIAVFAQTFSVYPALGSISPPYGTPSGGTTVTLTGAGFVTGLTVVTFDTSKATITSLSNTSITVTTPAHAEGKVGVSVVSNNHGARTSGVYTYGILQTPPNPRAGGGAGSPPNPAANPPPRPGTASGSGTPIPLPTPRP